LYLFLGTPVCGLRPLNRTSPSLVYKLTEILRTMIDGVRKQHILSITMIFYKKDDLNTVNEIKSIISLKIFHRRFMIPIHWFLIIQLSYLMMNLKHRFI
jgi:hypothetical protein